MVREMSRDPKAKDLWDTASLLRLGGLMGLFAALVHHFYDAFWDAAPEANLLVSVVARVVIYALAGALLLGALSCLRSWIMPDR